MNKKLEICLKKKLKGYIQNQIKKSKTDKTNQAADNKELADRVTKHAAGSVNNEGTVSSAKEPVTVEVIAAETAQTATQSISYTSIDVRL